jgi:hypothetical protein
VIAVAITLAVGIPGAAQAAGGWVVQPTPLPTGTTPAEFTGVSCPSAADCEAVMTYEQSLPAAEVWNGSSWTAQTMTVVGSEGSSTPESVSCSSPANCMAAGFAEAPTNVIAYAELWNGSTWTDTNPATTGGGTELYGVSCPSATSCVAVGEALTSNGAEPFAERWNGSIWKTMTVPKPSGNSGGLLNSVSCVSAADCVAVGQTPSKQALAYRWDGKSWAQQTLPAPAGATFTFLTGVSCTSTSSCTAVGNDNATAGSDAYAEQWNGTTWTVQVMPVPTGASGWPASVSCVSSSCTAAGYYFLKGRHALAEFFDGTSWTMQTTALPSSHKLFTGVSCIAARTCTAVGGTFMQQDQFKNLPLAERE